LRGGHSGLRRLEFCSGLLSNRWRAVVNPSGEQQPPKVFQPLAKHTKPNYNGQLQSVHTDCSCLKQEIEKIMKVKECEGWRDTSGRTRENGKF
jgi:hypothetical protein